MSGMRFLLRTRCSRSSGVNSIQSLNVNIFGIAVSFITLANPVRDELVKKESDWPYSGAIIPGYPSVHPLADGFWDLFWKLYVNEGEAESPPPPVPPLRA